MPPFAHWRIPVAPFVFLLFSSISCSSRDPITRNELLPRVAPHAAELALVNGNPLTLDAFLALRDRTPGLSDQDLLWGALAATALAESLEAEQATSLVLYALGVLEGGPRSAAETTYRKRFSSQTASPERVREALRRVLDRARIIRNEPVLASLITQK